MKITFVVKYIRAIAMIGNITIIAVRWAQVQVGTGMHILKDNMASFLNLRIYFKSIAMQILILPASIQ